MSRKATQTLNDAKVAKKDEFYTFYHDIEKEINAYLTYDQDLFKDKVVLCPCDDPEFSNFTKYFAQNFERFGMKKLISTSYATASKVFKTPIQLSRLEIDSEDYDPSKTDVKGKIFTLNRGATPVNIHDLKWLYLDGDGDFRSEEVKALRDEADIIITNPPFSLFREFIAWILEKNKKFLVIGNINCIAYKEIFPLLMSNQVWLGTGIGRWISGFWVPEGYDLYGTEAKLDKDGRRIVATNNCLWLTNMEHGKRHQPLSLMTMQDNIKFSRHKDIRGVGYKKYDNYDAIEVPYSDAIPSDYDGIIGVPLTFMDKYCPEQFEIVGPAMGWTQSTMSKEWKSSVGYVEDLKSNAGTRGYGIVEGVQKYHRILIRKVIS